MTEHVSIKKKKESWDSVYTRPATKTVMIGTFYLFHVLEGEREGQMVVEVDLTSNSDMDWAQLIRTLPIVFRQEGRAVIFE